VTAGNRASATADTDAKTLAELKTILNRIFNDDTDCKAQHIKAPLIEAFVFMGGDAMKLGTRITNNKFVFNREQMEFTLKPVSS
jgi:hypothetical protein